MVSSQDNQKETAETQDIKNGKKVLVLLDAHAILHRSFHALPPFTSPDGEPTGAVYGFVAFLIKLSKEMKPDYIAGCYDLPGATFRHEAYEEYKGKRAKVDDALIPQFNRSKDVLETFGIPVYSAPGFEADDMLGTIAGQMIAGKNIEKENLKIVIASGDLDTLQLVQGEDVVVYTLKKGINDTVIYDEKGVIERYGFAPKFVVDYKSLRGDPSDNIVGVPGIGEKSAGDIIKKFGSIENLYEALKRDKGELEKAGLKPRIIKLLEENEENAIFSKGLVEIRRDAPIKFSLDECEWRKKFDLEKVKTLFGKLGFKTLLERASAICFI